MTLDPSTPAGPAASPLLGLAGTGRERSFERGEPIFHEGDPGSFVLIVETGLIEISVTSASGRRSVLAWVGPGEVLGEISALDGGPRSADAVATEPVTGRVIQRRDLLQQLSAEPQIALDLIASLCTRIRNASDGLAGHALTSAPAKLAACLLRLSRDWGEPGENGAVRLTRPFSQADLGAFAGIARENVNRQLSRMSKAGLITYSAGVLELHDIEALSELLDDART